MYNIVIYPYDQTIKAILQNVDEEKYHISGIVSPKGWGYCGERLQLAHGDIRVCEKLSDIKQPYDAICLVNSMLDLKFDEYIRPLICACKDNNLDCLVCRDLSKEDCWILEQCLDESKLHILQTDFADDDNSEELYDFDVPVIAIANMFPALYSQDVQIEIYNELKKRGYKARLLTTKRDLFLTDSVGLISHIYKGQFGTVRDRILALNHYVKQTEIQYQPDVIIIGVEGNLLEISKTIIGDCGGSAFITSRSFPVDYLVCNTSYFPDFKEKYSDLEKCIENLFELRVDAYNITPKYLNLTESEEEGVFEYTELTNEFLKKNVQWIDKFYSSADKEDIKRLVSNIIDKLSGYAEIEIV